MNPDVGPQYIAELRIMASQLAQSIYINYEHISDFDAALCSTIESEFYRYASLCV